MRKLASLIVAVVLAAGCMAQNRIMSGTRGSTPAPHAAPPANGRTAGIRISGSPFEHRGFHRPFRGAGFVGGYGWPYFYDDYAGSYEPEPGPAAQPSAPVPAVQVQPE